jgi:hypothetical protein
MIWQPCDIVGTINLFSLRNNGGIVGSSQFPLIHEVKPFRVTRYGEFPPLGQIIGFG